MTPAWSDAIGAALLHSLWQGTVCAILLAGALAVFRSSPARYAAACAALAAVLACFTGTLAWQVAPSAKAPRPRAPDAVALLSDEESAAAGGAGFGFQPWLAPLWIAGAAIFQLRGVQSWMAARRLRRTGVCGASAEWQRRLRDLAARMRVSQPVLLLESCLADVPSAIGYLRPVILIPAGLLASMPPAQVEAILLHELAHIRRCDYLVNLLQTAAESLLYYHPAVWWISRVIREEREHCCDDLAVAATGGGASEYASALAALELTRWGMKNPQTAAMAASGQGELMKRIQRLLYPRQSPRRTSPWITPAWLAAPLLLAAVGMLAAWQAPAPAAPKVTPYTKWLTEDVAYIAEDRERDAFLRLETNEERQHFIAQFWDRRNPKPGSAENKAKQEHYRRIGYANERFRVPQKTAGWKTDRGRIYIVHGPPDELEKHPAEQREDWRYHAIEGLGKNVDFRFTDASKTGEFKLTIDPSKRPPR